MTPRGVINVIGAALSVLCAAGTYAQRASFQGIGDLPGGVFQSRALAGSSDGTVVGTSVAATGFLAYRWTENEGMRDLGPLPPVKETTTGPPPPIAAILSWADAY